MSLLRPYLFVQTSLFVLFQYTKRMVMPAELSPGKGVSKSAVAVAFLICRMTAGRVVYDIYLFTLYC